MNAAAPIRLTLSSDTAMMFVRLGFLTVWFEPTEQRLRIGRRGSQPDWYCTGIATEAAAVEHCDNIAANNR